MQKLVKNLEEEIYVRKLDPNIQRIQTTCDVIHNKRDDEF